MGSYSLIKKFFYWLLMWPLIVTVCLLSPANLLAAQSENRFGNSSLQRSVAEQSVARQWNEALLEAIRDDFARPVVHARNLFHVSSAMYDAWAAYDEIAEPFLLGNLVYGYHCPFSSVEQPADVEAARAEAISHAAYRLLSYRFQESPGRDETLPALDALMASLGYDAADTNSEYWQGSPASLGNAIAACYISFGQQDGANEQNDYASHYYLASNQPLLPALPGNPNMEDPNHWQPLSLDVAIDQAGNLLPYAVTPFLGPEWGRVVPFALSEDDLTRYERIGMDKRRGEYWVYHDPGAPPYLLDETGRTGEASIGTGSERANEYKWNFALTAQWASHLDPSDGVMWDISPAAMGNLPPLPTTFDAVQAYYREPGGGDLGTGWDLNPITGLPYEPQLVPRGDFTRVLAEFWADGPDSETPPGHWFTILNYVNDHPGLVKRYQGEGPLLNDLEWDIKTYFAMGGAVHDAAVAAWGIKGWYDYVRPISALRYMAARGQSSDPDRPSYHPEGIPLIDGFIELVEADDPLAGQGGDHTGKIKLFSWRGPDAIDDPSTDVAGVGWILAEQWWPYQRPTFVTPPFAGYVSGHSTYSRSAAEVLTRLTGDEFFPGGIAEFTAEKDEYLHFEKGPSVDVTLQWATYQDAAHQSGLSRIWGGIHPPADDIPGRRIGIEIGTDAFALADRYIQGTVVETLPHLSNPDAQVTTIDMPVTFGLRASDVNASLLYSATNLPPGLSLITETGIITGRAKAGGTYSVTVAILEGDDQDAQIVDTTSFTWRINLPPRLDAVPEQLNMLGDHGTLQLQANDPDGDRLTYRVAGLIPDLVVNKQSGEISGTLAFNGQFTMNVTVEDSFGGSDSTEFVWTINRLPAIANVAEQVNSVGEQVELQIRAIDTDGNELTYRATDLPRGLTIDRMTGLISGTITQSGTYTPTIIVDDGFSNEGANSSATESSFDWVVSNPPWLMNPGPQLDQRGSEITLSLVGGRDATSDQENGESLTYSALGLPFGLNLDKDTGVIAGTLLGVGGYSVTVTARDEQGSEGRVTFEWFVNAPPELIVPENQVTAQGKEVQLLVEATDHTDEPLRFQAQGLPPGLQIDTGSGLISGRSMRPGQYQVGITVDDGNGAEVSGAFTWTILSIGAEPKRFCIEDFCIVLPNFGHDADP
ncbi:MAG: putative Ig domain-containing protein [Chloroflexota bacterium]